MKKHPRSKVKQLESIEINYNDWYMILEALKLKEKKLREEAFYRGINMFPEIETLYGLIVRVSKIANLVEPPSLKRARISAKF